MANNSPMGPGFLIFFHSTDRESTPGGGAKLPTTKAFPPILVHRERDLEAIEFKKEVDIAQLLREDEEIIKIITVAIKAKIF